MAGTKRQLLRTTISIITIRHHPWIVFFTITITMATTSCHQRHVTPPTTTTIGLEALPRFKTIIKQRQ
jgi:hypothetical protein